MARLYPPQIEGTIPAFTGATLVVPFAMNKAVNINEIAGLELKVKTVQNDTFLFTTPDFNHLDEDWVSKCIMPELIGGTNYIIKFDLSDYIDKLKIGSFYKLQVAYIDKTGYVGYYSTVGVAKYTTSPKVDIDNLADPIGLNFIPTELIGSYSQKDDNSDTTERVYSYQYQLFNKDKELIEDSGELLHNALNDVRWDESYDHYEITSPIGSNELYYVRYYIKTQNGLTRYSPLYKIIDSGEAVKTDITGKLAVKNNFDNGYIEITFIDDDITAPMSGTYELYRCYHDKWDLLHKFACNGGKPSAWSYKDMTVEHGMTYRYGVVQYNSTNNIRSARKEVELIYDWYLEKYIPGNEIVAEFEDSFLFDGYRQLNIKYNPKVSSFKTDILEQKTDTIGSKYPFFFRNGNTYYKEFPISGLISYLSDSAELFKNYRDMDIEHDTYRRISTNGNKESRYVPQKEYNKNARYYERLPFNEYRRVNITEEEFVPWKYYIVDLKELKEHDYRIPTTDTNAYNIKAERQFKLDVLAWLNNGKPKLFRSPGEGNYIVRLMNVSLTPTDQVGRMLHSFNCTAYEIDKYSLNNLKNNNIWDLNGEKNNLHQMMYATYRSLAPYDKREEGEYKRLDYDVDLLKDLDNILGKASSIEMTDMIPGTQVLINDKIFSIGSTGTFQFLLEDGISSVKILNPRNINEFNGSEADYDLHRVALDAGQVTIGYNGIGTSTFDRYSKMTLRTIPTRQWFGKNKDIYNAPDYKFLLNKDIDLNEKMYGETMNDLCHEVISISYARFIQRNIEILYTDIKVDVNDKESMSASLEHLYQDPYLTVPYKISNNDETIYQIKCVGIDNTAWDKENKEPELEEVLIHNENYYINSRKDEFFDTSFYWDIQTDNFMNLDEMNYKIKFYGDVQDQTLFKMNSEEGEIDLKDTWMIEYTDLLKEDIEHIYIGPGVKAEITYNVLELEYSYPTTYKDDYYFALEDWINHGEISAKEVNEFYKQYIESIYILDNEYKISHGLRKE